MTLAAFLAAWALHLAAAASPGPAVLMAARTGAAEGLKVGVLLAVGLGLGAVVWAAAALFGLALLFEAAPRLLWALKVAGGLYLLWIAIGIWRGADAPLETGGGRPPRGARSALRLGVATQLANPKPAVFFGAVFLGTIPPDAPAWALAALLVAVFANEVGCNVVVARLFSLERPRRAYARMKGRLDRAFGGLLAAVGVKIAVS